MHATDYGNMLFSLMEKSTDRAKTLSGFVRYVYDNGDASLLPDIVRFVEEQEDKNSATQHVTVRIARDIDTAILKDAVTQVLKTDDFIMTIQRDEKILGGMAIETRNRIWDLTLRNQLNKLNLRLTQSL